jgi:hypothetical protein
MASDTPPDDDRDAEVDPWADIVADGLPDDGDQGVFAFADIDVRPQDPAGEPVAARSSDGPAPDVVAEDVSADFDAAFAPAAGGVTGDSTALADDVFAELIGGDGTDVEAGFDRDRAEGQDAVADDGAAWGDAAAVDGASWGDVVSEVTDDEDEPKHGAAAFVTDDEEMAVGSVVGAAAVATGADAARRASRRPARAKGGLGQFVGIVLGGALSIPIVLGILIGAMWMGRPDPIGMRRWLPGASFLLPPARQVRGEGGQQARGGGQQARGGGQQARGGGQQARGLDSLSVPAGDRGQAFIDPSDSTPPAADSGGPASAFAAAAPAAALAGNAVAAAAPTDAASEGTLAAAGLPAVDALAALSVPAVPDIDGVAAAAPMPPEPEPEPLDLATLDAAVEQAAAAAVILDGAAADDPDRRRHMVAWYRSLSRVAEELAAVEALAVESGRPFEEATGRLEPLMDGLAPDGPLGGDLVRLARNWLTYVRRDSDGVVLPVTFQSARPVGPYWCSKVVIEDAGGEPREVAVVSRQRPFLELGERCVVTGVLFDGGTVWAADVRSTDAPPAMSVVGDAALPERPVTAPPLVPPAAADAPAFPPPVGDAPPGRAPSQLPDIEVPVIPVPDIDVPAPPAPPAPPTPGPATPAADEF